MNMLYRILYTLLIAGVFPAMGADEFRAISSKKIYSLGEHTVYYYDTAFHAGPDSLLSAGYQSKFVKPEKKVNTFPHITAPLWFRFSVSNFTGEKLYLEVGEPSVNNITLYKVNNGKVTTSKSFGYYLPFGNREINSNNYLIDLELQHGETSEYLLMVSMRYKETITIPLNTGTLAAFSERNHRHDLSAGIFYGLIIMVLCFNIIIYFTIFDRSYLYFSLHAALASLWVANYYGHAFQFLWPNLPEINKLTPAITAASCIFVILFSRIFLKTAEYAPLMHKGLYILLYAFISSIIFNVFDFYFTSLVIVEIGSAVMCIYLIAIAVYVLRKGYSPAKFYILALFSFFAGVLVFVFQINGLLEARFITRNAVPLGLGLELALISFAQGNRLRFYRLEKKRTQEEMIRSFHEKEALLEEQKKLLEIKVTQQHIIETMRKRISQDIHDDLSSELIKINWITESVKKQIRENNTEAISAELAKITSYTRNTVKKLSEIIWAVNPEFDNLESLLSYIRNYVSSYLEDLNINYRIEFPSSVPDTPISPEFKRNIFLIIKECVNNCVKYSGAQTFSISFKRQNEHFGFIISDDGTGFDVSQSKGKGCGIRNMHDRMSKITGEISIQSSPGNGCRIELSGLTGR